MSEDSAETRIQRVRGRDLFLSGELSGYEYIICWLLMGSSILFATVHMNEWIYGYMKALALIELAAIVVINRWSFSIAKRRCFAAGRFRLWSGTLVFALTGPAIWALPMALPWLETQTPPSIPSDYFVSPYLAWTTSFGLSWMLMVYLGAPDTKWLLPIQAISRSMALNDGRCPNCDEHDLQLDGADVTCRQCKTIWRISNARWRPPWT